MQRGRADARPVVLVILGGGGVKPRPTGFRQPRMRRAMTCA